MISADHTPAQDTDLELVIARASRVWGEAVISDWLEGRNASSAGPHRWI